MAEPKPLTKKVGLTPGKAGLIAVLTVVLGVVLYIQLGSTEEMPSLAVVEGVDPLPPASATQAIPEPPAVAAMLATTAEAMQAESSLAIAAAFDESKWKSPELATVIAYDPFAEPDTFPKPVQSAVDLQAAGGDEDDEADAEAAAARLAEAVENLQSELRALQERGVHVIMRGAKDEYVAMIGDRTLHVGEEFEGFTVTAIGPDGVRVERKVNP